MWRRPLALIACALALSLGTAAAAQPPHARHTSATLTRFGSDSAFLAYLEETRAEAHRRGRWWYAASRIRYAQAGRRDWEPSSMQEDDEEPDYTPHRGLEVIPGSHGEYDVGEVMLDDGSQLFYSTLDLTQIRPNVEIVWPGMRRRGRVGAGDELGGSEGELWDAARRSPLYTLASIYRPVRDTLEPTVHAITICPPRAMLPARPRGCRTTAFVGPRGGELLVTSTHAFLWTVPEYGDLEALHSDPDCAARAAALDASGLPSQVYRLPLSGGELEVLGTRGSPAWGSGFLAGDGRLRALVAWPDIRCDDANRGNLTAPPARLTLLDAPLSLFGRRLSEVPAANERASQCRRRGWSSRWPKTAGRPSPRTPATSSSIPPVRHGSSNAAAARAASWFRHSGGL